ncbi:MAG: polysaccharide pyruvyl transferase family protein [bacterium JZ-2024 1]
MKVLCVGYFGRGNLGDDLYLSLLVPHLTAGNHQVAVLTRGPFAIPHEDKVWRIAGDPVSGLIRAVAWADLVLFPGGSVLQNASSNRSLVYYLSVCAYAGVAGKPIAFLSQGLGPLRGRIWRRLVLEAVRAARVFVARDEETARALRAEGMTNIEQSADWSWVAPFSTPTSSNGSEIVFVPNPTRLPPAHLFTQNCVLASCEMHSTPAVYAFARRYNLRWFSATTLPEWLTATARARFVISAKYHPAIFCLRSGFPVVIAGSDPKLRSLALRFSLTWFSDYSVLGDRFQELQPRSPSSDKLKTVTAQAQRNQEILDRVLAGD